MTEKEIRPIAENKEITNEEKAIDYATTECCHSCTSSCDKNKCKMFCNVRNAVLYGLAEGSKENEKENEKLNKKIRRYEEMLGSMFAAGNMIMQEQSRYEELRRL